MVVGVGSGSETCEAKAQRGSDAASTAKGPDALSTEWMSRSPRQGLLDTPCRGGWFAPHVVCGDMSASAPPTSLHHTPDVTRRYSTIHNNHNNPSRDRNPRNVTSPLDASLPDHADQLPASTTPPHPSLPGTNLF